MSNKKKSRLLQIPSKIGEKFRRSRSPSPQPSSTPQPSHPTNMYVEVSGLGTSSPASQMKEGSITAYAALQAVAQGIYNCSDSFLPLKAGVGVFLEITKRFDLVSANRQELRELELNLKAIISIVEKYQQNNAQNAINRRIETFCQAIDLQVDAVKDLRDHPLWKRIAEATTDADRIKKSLRNMNDLCRVFQMDTQLNIDDNVTEILELLNSSVIDDLRCKETSYNTRHSSYGAARECMEGTRVKILADLETWALDDSAKKVYWLVGMAGTGKSTILHTLCHNLDDKHRLGGSFFCSRASDDASNARLIVPAIAHSLASTSPSIKSQIVAALKDEPKLAERTYIELKKQFKMLIRDPIRTSLSQDIATYKVIVIDALDECSDDAGVFALIRVILDFAPHIPLKFVIASRDEGPIRTAFRSRSDIVKVAYT